jgi:hypothetical protein
MNVDSADRQLLATTAALLDQGRLIDGLSRVMTAAALIGLMLWPAIGGPLRLAVGTMLLVALAGAIELVLAIRVGFDAALFHRLAQGTGSLDGLDGALAELGLLPRAKAGRAAAARARGARRLLLRQGTMLAVQLALAILGTILEFAGR